MKEAVGGWNPSAFGATRARVGGGGVKTPEADHRRERGLGVRRDRSATEAVSAKPTDFITRRAFADGATREEAYCMYPCHCLLAPEQIQSRGMAFVGANVSKPVAQISKPYNHPRL